MIFELLGTVHQLSYYMFLILRELQLGGGEFGVLFWPMRNSRHAAYHWSSVVGIEPLQKGGPRRRSKPKSHGTYDGLSTPF